MTHIAVTQRVDIIESYGERRDALDQRWIEFLQACGVFPVIMPNHPAIIGELLARSKIDGLLLTGGNSLSKYGGNAPERDTVEKQLLEYALARNLPVLGVCRGMQVIQDYFGQTLKPVSAHVATRHRLKVVPHSRYFNELNTLADVNAYHDFGAYESVPDLPVAAYAEDGVVMAVAHVDLPVFGQMWHSEREKTFVEEDIMIFKRVFINV